jgi:hypothetical protein
MGRYQVQRFFRYDVMMPARGMHGMQGATPMDGGSATATVLGSGHCTSARPSTSTWVLTDSSALVVARFHFHVRPVMN